MDYKKVYLDKKLIAGVFTQTSKLDEENFEEAKVPALWQSYFQNSIFNPISNEIEGSPAYAVLFDFQKMGKYSVLIGTEVNKTEGLSGEYSFTTIEAGEYLKFNAKGKMPEVLNELWEKIREFFKKSKDFQRAFKSDFEVYEKEDEVSIFIGTKWFGFSSLMVKQAPAWLL